jgi:hypothetical protein
MAAGIAPPVSYAAMVINNLPVQIEFLTT